MDEELDLALTELLGGAATFFLPPSAQNPTGPAGKVGMSRAFISRLVLILHVTVRSCVQRNGTGGNSRRAESMVFPSFLQLSYTQAGSAPD